MCTDDKSFLFLVGSVIAALFLFVLTFVRITNELSFPAELAKIEQLRSDAAEVNMASNEDVIGQVVSWNQAIREAQAYRGLWYGRLVTPARWERVLTIDIPQ